MPAVSTLGADLPRVLLTLAVLLLLAHAFGGLVRRVHLPQVLGEILGGLVLGPSVLGVLLPAAHAWLTVPWMNSILYWMGLVLLMFVAGFEVDRALTGSDGALVGAVLAGSTVLPFAAGWLATSFTDVSGLMGPANHPRAFQLTFATACAVTSIPVLSKIFLDLGIMGSRFAKIVLAAAMIHDGLLFVALSAATGLVRAGTGPASDGASTGDTLRLGLTTCALAALGAVVGPRALRRAGPAPASASLPGYFLVVCFVFAALAGVLGVNVIFGAFVAGLTVASLSGESAARAREATRDAALAFFVPLYFAVVGFRLDLVRHLDLGVLAAFLLFSTAAQVTGTVLAARAAGERWRPSWNLGVAMNCRGGPGIVVATIALEAGIVNERFATSLVIAAVLTSVVTGWWLRRTVGRGGELLGPPRPSKGG